MGFFRSKNKDGNSVVWRDKTGKIRCMGNHCSKECDDSCPIYLNTHAGMMFKMGMFNETLPIFEQIIRIAPDFYDAWNNMAAVYGKQAQYQKANECYAKAHELSPNRPAPILGLALTSRDLGKYEECLKWCDEYDKISNDHRVDNARNTALASLGR